MSSRILSLVFAIVAGLALQACTGVTSLEKQPMNTASVRVFDEPRDAVVRAAEASIRSLGYELNSVKKGESSTQVYFTKSASALNLGELGRIDVESHPKIQATRVSISISKRWKGPTTGASPLDISAALFKSITKNLN